jgi:ubiquinone/menaquinone biosynthesis C-methylase UbiE
MINDINVIIDFYQRYDEDNRMNRNPLEYLRCKEIIGRYLSNGKMDIVDIGGATGTFSFWLANLGHGVNLVDIVPKHIETATRRQQELGIRLHSALVCDARQLPYESGSFDLALMMGPLYHLLDRKDRIQSIQEAYRVLKPNGIILCEVISRFASMLDGFFSNFAEDPEFIEIMLRDIDTGLHKDTSSKRMYFTDAYLHLPNEVSEELTESGFQFEKLIAVTSFGHIIPDLDNKIKDETFKNTLLNTIRLVETDPALMGISSHYIGIGKKPLA